MGELVLNNPALSKPAILALEDGSVFHGTAIGADGVTSGEVVFNTAMTGYQEILTDPSYTRQIVTLTYPHIGNTGINSEDVESASIAAAGLVIRDLPLLASSFRSEQTLSDYLKSHNVLGIADIDTRRLTRILRDKGAQNGAILAGADAEGEDAVERALAAAKAFPGLKGMDLAKEVSCKEAYEWSEGEWALGEGYADASQGERPYHVVAFDYGVKFNILRMLAARGCRLTVVPAQTPAAEVLASSWLTAPATPSPVTTPSKRSRKCWKPTRRCSAFAWATSCWRWPPVLKPSRWATATTVPTTRCKTWIPAR